MEHVNVVGIDVLKNWQGIHVQPEHGQLIVTRKAWPNWCRRSQGLSG